MQLLEHIGARTAAALEEHRSRAAAAIDADRAVRPGERREREQRSLGQHRIPVGLVEIQPIRRQRPIGNLAVTWHQAARGVVVLDHLQPRRQHLVCLVVQADRGARQIVEQSLHPIMEQRHPVLHAGMSSALRDREVDRILGRRLAEHVAPARAEAGDRIGVERHLRHRPKGQALSAIGAALGGGIEDADRLDGVAEQVEPHRIGLTGGKDVDDAAAHGVFARLHDRAGAAIAAGFQEARELLGLHGAVGAQLKAGTAKRGPRRHALHQRVHRGQHDARTGRLLQQARQRGDALRHQCRIGRHAVVREAVPGGEAQHFRFRRDEGQRLRQPRHSRVVARYMEDGTRKLTTTAGEQEGVPTLGGAEDRCGGHRSPPPPSPSRKGRERTVHRRPRSAHAAASGCPPPPGSAGAR